LYQNHLKQHPNREEYFRTHAWKNDQKNYEHGLFWLVHSKHITIQGRYRSNTDQSGTSLYSLAISGDFINHNRLVIRPKNDYITWNRKKILTKLGTSFDDEDGLVSAKYHTDSTNIQDGSWCPGVDVHLPMGVKLTINRWNESVNVEINMCKHGRQGGICGNFNGNQKDDTFDGARIKE